MGHCDVCGNRTEMFDKYQIYDIRKTDMKKYGDFNLTFICEGCYKLLLKFNKGNLKAFNNLNFARLEVRNRFQNKKESKRLHDEMQEKIDKIFGESGFTVVG